MGGLFFTVGYLLSAEVVRIIWLTLSGMVVLVSLLMTFVMVVSKRDHFFTPPKQRTAWKDS